MPGTSTRNDQLLINALRCLSIDMVQAANSGHPGLPLGAAPMAYTVFARHLRFNPSRPDWFNRDRFILSPGHGSALLYSLLHLFGYDLPMSELKQFRQLGSKTPGHPEVGLTPGVECTTGPLGQGFATGVGMAIAERWFNNRYGNDLADYHIYGVVSDGDLMEGVAQEAASLAGHMGLGKIVYLYDSNDISLDGPCHKSYSEDTEAKFEAMNWDVHVVEDGNDVDAIDAAINAAKSNAVQPSLIIVKTEIGFGSPVAGSSKSHGAPLGADNVITTKKALGWESEEPFFVTEGFGDVAEEALKAGENLTNVWDEQFESLRSSNHVLWRELECIITGELPECWDAEINDLSWPDGSVATRDAGQAALNAVANKIPWLIGGGADLASSTKTIIKSSGDFDAESQADGRNIWFGVREHAMGAIVNGLALSGLRPFGSTFLVFSDYMRGAIRLAALTAIDSMFIFTHDSVFVGEDGPTHQPIEHISALRLIPNLLVYRPADALETAACYQDAIARGGASTMVLTRQGLPVLNEFAEKIREGVSHGGYVLSGVESPQVCLVATGSEVSLALKAQKQLEADGIKSSVISVPCRELFMGDCLPDGVPCVIIEAGVTQAWGGFGKGKTASVGIDRFGESGPGDEVYDHVNMTVDHVVEVAKSLL
ncbi:MAG: transketolase [Fimbriimonadaceae bacterium]|nr:MAG: transketolase [Fimbriimonadaceae bacterium]